MSENILHLGAKVDVFEGKYDRYYFEDKELAHLAPYGVHLLLCGADFNDDETEKVASDDYLGTGSQQEWDYARRLPICDECLRFALDRK